MLTFLKSKNIVLTGYSPLGRPHRTIGNQWAIRHPKIHELARKYHKSSAQIILRWAIQRGLVVVPKSQQLQHQQENLNIFHIFLMNSDMAIIDAPHDNNRLSKFDDDINHSDYPFNIEF